MARVVAGRCLSATDFEVPPADRYFEDYKPGAVYEYGTVTLSEQEIVDFAARYDPQSIHTDPVAAAAGPFGGIIASGMHTTAVCMRLFVDHYISYVASMASPGLDELRWPAPVRPGDTLRLRTTVDAARTSRSDPTRGIVSTTAEAFTEQDTLVMSFRAVNFLRRREPGS